MVKELSKLQKRLDNIMATNSKGEPNSWNHFSKVLIRTFFTKNLFKIVSLTTGGKTMKYMTEEQMAKYPSLVIEAIRCQRYLRRIHGRCHGCSQAISSCKDIIRGG